MGWQRGKNSIGSSWKVYVRLLNTLRENWVGTVDPSHPAFLPGHERKRIFDNLSNEELEPLRNVSSEHKNIKIQEFIETFSGNYHIPAFIQPVGVEEEILHADVGIWRKILIMCDPPKGHENTVKKSGFTRMEKLEIREKILKEHRKKYGFDTRKRNPGPVIFYQHELRKKGKQF